MSTSYEVAKVNVEVAQKDFVAAELKLDEATKKYQEYRKLVEDYQKLMECYEREYELAWNNKNEASLVLCYHVHQYQEATREKAKAVDGANE